MEKLIPPLRLGVLGSGKGSNYRAIQQAINDGSLNAQVVIVLSDVQDAGILALAKEHNVPARFIHPGKFRTKLEPAIEEQYVRALQEAKVDLVVLAGYMRMIKEPLLKGFPGKIINIHPSLLPKFPGLEAWRQALEAGEKVTGCTVHYVDSGMDTGEIIAQSQVPVLADDTAETVHARIQVAEHTLYPEVLRSFCRS